MTPTRPEPGQHDAVDLVFRISTSLIFVVAGLGHVFRPEQMVAQLEAAPLAGLATSLASAEVLVALGGPPLVIGGLGLLAGARTRASAALLVVVLVPITVITHAGSMESMGPLFKNVALLGALVHFAIHGAGRYSVDQRKQAVPPSP
ncbi:MAG: DoxX family protein [Pseudomonadota bacterium]|nr:DoxX family protein [Pseudomonadota bacterium]